MGWDPHRGVECAGMRGRRVEAFEMGLLVGSTWVGNSHEAVKHAKSDSRDDLLRQWFAGAARDVQKRSIHELESDVHRLRGTRRHVAARWWGRGSAARSVRRRCGSSEMVAARC